MTNHIDQKIGMHELVGKRCTCDFALDPRDWPIPGYPAFVIVDSVDMPMVKMRSVHAGAPIWVNVSAIRTIMSSE